MLSDNQRQRNWNEKRSLTHFTFHILRNSRAWLLPIKDTPHRNRLNHTTCKQAHTHSMQRCTQSAWYHHFVSSTHRSYQHFTIFIMQFIWKFVYILCSRCASRIYSLFACGCVCVSLCSLSVNHSTLSSYVFEQGVICSMYLQCV